MNKKELVNQVAEKTGFTKKDTEQVIDGMLEVMQEALVKGEDVKIVGHFSLEKRERAGRTGRNPQNGEEIEIPATKVVKFKVGKQWKDAVANS